MEMPGCFRHMTRSGWWRDILVVCMYEQRGVEERKLRLRLRLRLDVAGVKKLDFWGRKWSGPCAVLVLSVSTVVSYITDYSIALRRITKGQIANQGIISTVYLNKYIGDSWSIQADGKPLALGIRQIADKGTPPI